MKVYAEWLWPLPVVLTKIQECPTDWESKNLTPWNPRINHYDFQHVMPIITPAFPAMNSSLSVHNNHKKIMSDEFKRSYDIMNTLNKNSTDEQIDEAFKGVFKNFNFIDENKYTYFLKVEICASTQEAFVKWEGQVTSKIRKYLFEAIYDLIN
jgi:poly(A) polymerase